jgi:hypothetical protein
MQLPLEPSNPPLFASIFLEFNLPNSTTWFYFSLLLAVALFFKFSRFVSIRNLDILTIFLLVPGLLLLRESARNWFGYLWLFIGSGVLLLRCLLDLTLVRRPALAPNLNLGGLAWLGGALFVCLVVVAFRQGPAESLVQGSPLLHQAQTTLAVGLKDQIKPAPDVNVAFLAGTSLAVLCHLLIVSGLLVIGCWHFQDAHAGMAMATFYLLLPYTAMHVGQWHHVWPMALFVWAVTLYRVPTVAGLLMGLAAGTMYFPALTLPVWCSFYWRRGTARFLLSFVVAAAVCFGVLGGILSRSGGLPESLQSIVSLTDWQPWSAPTPDTEGFWTGVPWAWAYRMPVFIAYVAFISTTLIWPAPKNLAHLLALSGAALIGVQFWYAEKGGVYVLWYLPLLLMMVFRPNLSDRRPPATQPGTDWLSRLIRFTGRVLIRIGSPPEAVAQVR